MATVTKRASDVRVQEINLSQIIATASTSVACIPVVSKQGQVVPRHFTNADDFIFEYGDSNPSISWSIQCAKDFFTEGNDLWALRVVGSGAKYAAALLYIDGGVAKLKPVTEGVKDPTNPDWEALVPSPNNTPVALFYGNRGPGSYAKPFGLTILSSTLESPASLTASSSSQGGSLPAATYEYRVASIDSSGNETLVSEPVQIILSNPGVTNSVPLEWDEVEGAIGYYLYGRTPGAGMLTQLGGGVTSFTDTGALTPDPSHQPIDSADDLADASSVFQVRIFNTDENKSTPIETFDCTLGYNTDSSGTQTELEDRINPYSQYLQVTSNAAALVDLPTIGTISEIVNLGGGDSGTAPTSYNIAKALEVFLDKQLYSINMFINGGFSDPIVQKKMDAIAQSRGDMIALLDTPSASQKFQAAIDYRNLVLNLNSTYSALFCPDVLEADLVNGRQVYVPFSGWAAALVARTDRVANPSFSIAGLNRGLVDVLKARYSYDDGQASAMFKAQVNYLRTFVGQGIALWEQQTLSAEFSALSWLSVRRLVNIIKTSLYQFLLYALQEPNTDALGRQIVDSLTTYLQAWKDAQGLSDFTAISNSTNNNATLENAGIRVVTVVLIPVIPTHEIQLQVVVSKQGVSFKEVLSQIA